MSADKRQNCRFLNTWQHMGGRKAWRRIKEGIALIVVSCLLLCGMDMTAFAMSQGHMDYGGIPAEESGTILETGSIVGEADVHIKGENSAAGLELLAEDGSGHVHTAEEHDSWQEWKDTTKLPTESGNYYLAVDVDLTALCTIGSNITINLCLNGHTVRQTKTSVATGVILVKGTGAQLSIYDCSGGMTGTITGGKGSSANGGGITVSGGGSLNLYGGKISGNTATSGGGIYVASSSSATVYGGEISGNNATNGGGVYSYGNSSSFAINGGNITGNTATTYGGGIYVGSSSSVIIGGGIIGSNTGSGTSSKGGGIYVASGTVTMSEGEITGNQAVSGGGIYATSSSSTFNLNGGSVAGNTATGDGGGIYAASNSKLTISGGAITANTASTKGGGICYASSFTVKGGAIYANKIGEEINNLQVSSTSYSYKAAINGGLILGGLMEAAKFYDYDSNVHPGEIAGTIGNELTGKKGDTVTAVLAGAQLTDILYASTAEEITTTADGKLYRAVYLASAEGNGTWDFRWVPDIGTIFMVTYESNGGTIENEGSFTQYSYGTELRLPTAQEITREGYEFLGWYEEADFTGSPVTSIASDALFDGDPVYYARWRERHICSACPEEHDAITDWTPWEDSTVLPDSAGNYYLVTDVNLTDVWTVKGMAVNLCLNGHTIRQTKESAGVITVAGSGADLAVFDCSQGRTGTITGGKATSTSTGGGINVGSSSGGSGSLKLYGGRISGNEAVNGGGIYMTNSASSLAVDGGIIESNTATGTTTTSGRGGGIYVAGGSVVLSSGKVTGNTANYGGGIYATGSGTKLTMEGGSIDGNTAASDGGGIYAASSSVPVIKGGTISGNNAAGNGGGIYGGTTKLEINGGAISSNEAVNGGGIFYASSFTVNGGAVYGNTTGGAVNNLEATSTTAAATLNGGLILGGLEGKGKYNHSSDANPMYAGEITGTIGGEITSKKGEAVTAVLSGAQRGDTLYASTAEEITSIGGDGKTYKGIYLPATEGTTGIWSFRWVPDAETKFKIKYETYEGTISNPENYAEYTYGTKLPLPTEQEITREGYEFLGWYETADFTGTSVTSIAADTLFEGEPVFYAKWRHKHICAGCSAEHDAVASWTPWEDTAKLPDSAGSYYLTADVVLTDVWAVGRSTAINLCLNGHTIRQTNESGGVILVSGSGAILSIYDCSVGMTGAITGGKSTSATVGGGITVSTSGTLNLYGGKISGNEASNGGGIYVASSSSATVFGGEITGNQAANGGGVYATGSTGKFTLEGGSVTGNHATDKGGGIYVASSSKPAINGGTISGNEAANSGGGVYVSSGAVSMTGGEIRDNQAASGGGVYTYGSSSTFTLNGGSVTGNTATADGGGIYAASSSTAKIEGGAIADNTAGNGGGIYAASGSKPTLSAGSITGNTATGNGGGIYAAASSLSIAGGSITSNQAASGGGGILYAASFTMTGGAVYKNTVGGDVNNLYGSASTNTASLKGGLILDGLGGNGKYNYNKSLYPMYSGVVAGMVGDTVTNGKDTIPGVKVGDVLIAGQGDEITIESVLDGQTYVGIYTASGEGTWQFQLPSGGITLDRSEASLDYPENAQIQLTAAVTGTLAGDAVTWSSSDEAVATVSVDGMVTAKQIGTATITAEVGEGLTASCEITVSGSVYAVAYHTNGGTMDGGDTGSYTYGTGLKLPDNVAREGYTFNGWFENETCTGSAVTEISAAESGNKDFYAKWTEDIPEETPSPTPTLSPTPSPSPTPTPSPSLTPSPSPTPTSSPTPSPSPTPTPSPSLTPSPSPTPTSSPTPSPSPSPTPDPGPMLTPSPSPEPSTNPGENPGETSVPVWNINDGQQTIEGDIWVKQPVIEVELPGNLDFGINPYKLDVNAGNEDAAPNTDQIISGEYYVTNYSNVAVAVTATTFVSTADDKVEMVPKDGVAWSTAGELKPSATAGNKAVWLVQLYPSDIDVSDTGSSMTVAGIIEGITTGTDAKGDTLIKGTEANVAKRPVFVLAAWDETSNETKEASVAGFKFSGAVDPYAPFEDGDIMVKTVFELNTLTAEQAGRNYEDYETIDGVTGFCDTIKQKKAADNP